MADLVGVDGIHAVQGYCDWCGEVCDASASDLNALDCSYKDCPSSVYHQDCLEKFLKTQRLEKNRKTGFKCPRGCGKGTRSSGPCPGKIEKSHPIVARSDLSKKRRKAVPPPPPPPKAPGKKVDEVGEKPEAKRLTPLASAPTPLGNPSGSVPAAAAAKPSALSLARNTSAKSLNEASGSSSPAMLTPLGKQSATAAATAKASEADRLRQAALAARREIGLGGARDATTDDDRSPAPSAWSRPAGPATSAAPSIASSSASAFYNPALGPVPSAGPTLAAFLAPVIDRAPASRGGAGPALGTGLSASSSSNSLASLVSRDRKDDGTIPGMGPKPMDNFPSLQGAWARSKAPEDPPPPTTSSTTRPGLVPLPSIWPSLSQQNAAAALASNSNGSASAGLGGAGGGAGGGGHTGGHNTPGWGNGGTSSAADTQPSSLRGSLGGTAANGTGGSIYAEMSPSLADLDDGRGSDPFPDDASNDGSDHPGGPGGSLANGSLGASASTPLTKAQRKNLKRAEKKAQRRAAESAATNSETNSQHGDGDAGLSQGEELDGLDSGHGHGYGGDVGALEASFTGLDLESEDRHLYEGGAAAQEPEPAWYGAPAPSSAAHSASEEDSQGRVFEAIIHHKIAQQIVQVQQLGFAEFQAIAAVCRFGSRLDRGVAWLLEGNAATEAAARAASTSLGAPDIDISSELALMSDLEAAGCGAASVHGAVLEHRGDVYAAAGRLLDELAGTLRAKQRELVEATRSLAASPGPLPLPLTPVDQHHAHSTLRDALMADRTGDESPTPTILSLFSRAGLVGGQASNSAAGPQLQSGLANGTSAAETSPLQALFARSGGEGNIAAAGNPFGPQSGYRGGMNFSS